MKKILISLIGLCCLLSTTNAQNTFQPRGLNTGSQGIIYDKEVSIDLRPHTNGYAIAANFGKIKTYYLTRYFQIELGELKHHKEYRRNDLNSGLPGRTSRSYVFGKQNNFYALRGGYGQKRYFSEKARKKGLAVGITYELGPSIGVLKPYYLEIRNARDGNSETISIKYSAETQREFLNRDNIEGSSSAFKGWSEASVLPGGQAKFAVHFGWGAFDEFVKAFEAGIMADVYFKKVPIMVESDLIKTENRPFFVNLYLNLQFGKRW